MRPPRANLKQAEAHPFGIVDKFQQQNFRTSGEAMTKDGAALIDERIKDLGVSRRKALAKVRKLPKDKKK